MVLSATDLIHSPIPTVLTLAFIACSTNTW